MQIAIIILCESGGTQSWAIIETIFQVPQKNCLLIELVEDVAIQTVEGKLVRWAE